MANERLTEDIVRTHFRDDPLFKSIRLEEQRSFSRNVTRLLKSASKTGGKGQGLPEFLITFPSDSRYLVVIECKALPVNHESPARDRPADYAVDGVLNYAKALSAEYDVIAVAVSGETREELRVSQFLWRNGAAQADELPDHALLSLNSYLHLFANEQFADNLRTTDIVQKAIELNEEYNNYSINEMMRNTMVSAILLSLINPAFRASYAMEPTIQSLSAAMMNAIDTTLTAGRVRSKDAMLGELRKITNDPLFVQTRIKDKATKQERPTLEVLKEIIDYLYRNVYPLTTMEHAGYDVLGRFYTEFIRYAGSEQKQGLVLTPFHVTDLFCDLAELTAHDVLYDPCCGTAGFLVAGMKRMFREAGNDEAQKDHVRQEQLVGVEMRPSMYTYACANMLLRGDGKSNIYCGDCFQTKGEILSDHAPTAAFLNPPYDVGTAEQLRFVAHALDVVAPQNGRVVAIVQMSCAIKNEKDLIAVKEDLLKRHHLKAVLSMPDDLFYPMGVVTCILVFEANKPNKGRKTWFGYFKDDGFEKRKHQGRFDARGRFKNEIREKWLSAYRNLDEIPGLSVRHEVAARDEWCAEAYMETDYSSLTEADFQVEIRKYIAASILHQVLCRVGVKELINDFGCGEGVGLSDRRGWLPFRYGDLFDIRKGKRLTKEDMVEGPYPFIGATDANNGITAHVANDEFLHEGNKITVSYNGSIAEAFYQPVPFVASDDVNVLYPSFPLNKHIAIFLCTLIRQEKYRFNYGRKWHAEKMRESVIRLPALNGKPDWDYMERFVKGLAYSANL